MKHTHKTKHAAQPAVYKAVVGGSKHKANRRAAGLAATAALVIAALGIGLFALVHHRSSHSRQPATATAQLPDNTSPSADTEPQNLAKSSVPAVTNSVLTTHSFAALGQYLADPTGNALYTYDKDTGATSACTGDCANIWPIYEASSTAGLPPQVSTITRTDGKKQYTYKGKPLYYYQVDQQSGGVNGDGLNGFHVAKP